MENKKEILNSRAKKHIQRLIDNPDYWGEIKEVNEMNTIVEDAKIFLSNKEMNDWNNYALKSTTIESLKYLISILHV